MCPDALEAVVCKLEKKQGNHGSNGILFLRIIWRMLMIHRNIRMVCTNGLYHADVAEQPCGEIPNRNGPLAIVRPAASWPALHWTRQWV